MPQPRIYFFAENCSFNLPKKRLTKKWLIEAAASEGCVITNLNYIFCNDAFLLTVNKKYLNHNSYTDIITFQYDADAGCIAGDVYISVDRVKHNAEKFGQAFPDELARVMAHGLLHLCGYNDKTPAQKREMRKAEGRCLHQLMGFLS